MKTYITTVFPTTADYPVSLEEARMHLRVPGNDDEDQMIRSKIKAAVAYIENQTSVVIAPRTMKLLIEKMPDNITIDRYPVTEITSIEYYDENDALQRLPTSKYNTDIDSQPANIKILEKIAVSSHRPKSVIINFTVGFIIQSVPAELKEATLLTLAHLYDNRGDEGHRTIAKTVNDLVAPLKQMTW